MLKTMIFAAALGVPDCDGFLRRGARLRSGGDRARARAPTIRSIVRALQHLAAIAALRPSEDRDYLRASRARGARLFGFVDARLTALGAPRQNSEEQEYVRATTVLRKAVDPPELESLMRIGAMMTEEQAVEEAFAED